MRTILAFVLVTLCAAASCKTLGPVVWPTAVKCLSAPSAELVSKVKVIVEQDGLAAAFSDKTLSALEDLARSYGPDVIACVLRELLDAYTAPTGMATPPDQLAAARRIQAFFVEHDLEVRGQGETEP
jgi:hypothetical protein